MKLTIISIIMILLVGCSSKPADWSGMTQSEISQWQEIGLGPAEAQLLRKNGLSASETKGWIDIGIKAGNQILVWKNKGFSAESAKSWIELGFDAATSASWFGKKFTAEEARQWVDAGFDLKKAIENRSKGLQPID